MKKYSGNQLINYIKNDLDPCLAQILIDALNEIIVEQVLKDKSDLAFFLQDQMKISEISNEINESMNGIFPKKLDFTVKRRVLDLNLLYAISYIYNTKIGRKIARAHFEFVIESILRNETGKSKSFDYEFVDWKALDYIVSDKSTKNWIIGIQCKTALHTNKGALNYVSLLDSMKDFKNKYGDKKELIVICGQVYGYKHQKNTERINMVKSAFENEGFKFYHLWETESTYAVDQSLYEFIEQIKTACTAHKI
jgi:hypothetical protein